MPQQVRNQTAIHRCLNALVIMNALMLLSSASAHNFHVTYGKMAVEGKVAACQIKFFRDDLESALKKEFSRSAIRLEANPFADSLFMRYLDSRLEVESGGKKIPSRLTGSGEEADMWWYKVEFESPSPLANVKVKNTLLFELFSDQKNLLQVMKFPEEKLESFYFTSGSEDYALSF
jgi:hypothetical protein